VLDLKRQRSSTTRTNRELAQLDEASSLSLQQVNDEEGLISRASALHDRKHVKRNAEVNDQAIATSHIHFTRTDWRWCAEPIGQDAQGLWRKILLEAHQARQPVHSAVSLLVAQKGTVR
jgi:hypothetical protein